MSMTTNVLLSPAVISSLISIDSCRLAFKSKFQRSLTFMDLFRLVGHRERLRRLLAYSRRVQIVIVALVILDSTIVIVELLIDLNVLGRAILNIRCSVAMRSCAMLL